MTSLVFFENGEYLFIQEKIKIHQELAEIRIEAEFVKLGLDTEILKMVAKIGW